MRVVLYFAASVAVTLAARHVPGGSPNHPPHPVHHTNPHLHPPLCRAVYENGTVLKEHPCSARRDMSCQLGPIDVTDRYGDKLHFYGCIKKPCKEVDDNGVVRLDEPCPRDIESCSAGPVDLTLEGVRLDVTFCSHKRHYEYDHDTNPDKDVPTDMAPVMYNMLMGWTHDNLADVMETWAHSHNPKDLAPCKFVLKEYENTVVPARPCPGQKDAGEDLCVIGPQETIHGGKKVDEYFCKKPGH